MLGGINGTSGNLTHPSKCTNTNNKPKWFTDNTETKLNTDRKKIISNHFIKQPLFEKESVIKDKNFHLKFKKKVK